MGIYNIDYNYALCIVGSMSKTKKRGVRPTPKIAASRKKTNKQVVRKSSFRSANLDMNAIPGLAPSIILRQNEAAVQAIHLAGDGGKVYIFDGVFGKIFSLLNGKSTWFSILSQVGFTPEKVAKKAEFQKFIQFLQKENLIEQKKNSDLKGQKINSLTKKSKDKVSTSQSTAFVGSFKKENLLQKLNRISVLASSESS
jgi:hypothetical protein